MIVVVGLGNPGKEYENTYHNMGYMCVDAFASSHGASFSKSKYHAMYAETFIGDEKVIILKPTTYMNLSGVSVAECVNKLKLPPDKLIVVYDDIDLPFGAIRIRKSGSAGTHNGMRNIVELLGTEKFSRLRVGIGRDEKKDLKDFVLSKVSKDNMTLLENEKQKIVKVIDAFISFKGDVERIDINNY
ncbi:MAG: aminoacyl-tRNA hydrolase [Clostridia bacterium]|nr:aminoacyl-tRNA hydrolase [Clostridia bacterium]